jgi:hypothetical protein
MQAYTELRKREVTLHLTNQLLPDASRGYIKMKDMTYFTLTLIKKHKVDYPPAAREEKHQQFYRERESA